MDIDALASEFGSKSIPPSDNSGIDVHALVSEFGSAKKAEELKNIPKVYIDTTNLPKPFTEGQGDNPPSNPRDAALAEGIKNYIPSIGEAIKTNAIEGASNFSTGLGDIVNRGELGAGAKKMGLGALQAVTSIPAGIVSEGIEKPVTQLTGNPDIGSRAGFIGGSAVPIVPGASLVSKMRPSNVALKDLTDMITNHGANPENLVPVIQEMKKNSRLGPVDLNPAVLAATQKLAVTEGDATKNYLAKTSADRIKTSKDAVTDAYDTVAGVPVNAVAKLKELADAAKKVGTEKINPSIKGANSVDLSPVIDHIDEILKPGVMQRITGESTLPFSETKKLLADVKKTFANKNEQLTDAQALHNLQSKFRQEAEARMNSGDGKERQLGYALMQVRNKIVDAIDKASPQVEGKGTYKPALSEFRDEKHIAESFHDGYNGVLTNSKKLENRPEFTEEWFKGLTEHEKKAAIEGLRTRIDTEIGVAKNPALAGTSLSKSDFNQKKMETMLGKEETQKLLDKLEHERAIANTHNKLFENSQTAARIKAESKVDLTPPKEPKDAFQRLATIAAYTAPEAANMYAGSAIPGIGLAASLASHGVSKLTTAASNKITRALELERNAQLARYALPTEGPSRDELIKHLERAIPGPKQSILRKAGTLARLAGP